MDQNQAQQQMTFSAKLTDCRICGDTAHHINYGTLACASCKIFFRRHAYHIKNVCLCEFDGNCEINKSTRKCCTACRLTKCFASGMNPDLIRKEDIRKKPHALTVVKQTMAAPPLPTLDLLCHDRSSLTLFDWTMLSNVIHAFDRFSPISQTRQVIEHLSAWPQHLSFDISQILPLFAQFYTSTESFISSSADFQILTLNEKHSLYQRNLHGVLNLWATFILTISGMFNISTNESILTSIYGYDIYQQTKQISMRLEHDRTIIKLLLLTLAFSTNCYMVDEHEHMHNDSLSLGTFRLFGSQNMYVEILWKYMTYRYGYYGASIHLVKLIKIVLDLLKMSGSTHQTNEIHQNFVVEVAVLAEQSLTINENEVVILWGKE